MQNKPTNVNRQIILGWLLLGIGGVCFLIGVAFFEIPRLNIIPATKLVSGLGILIAGLGVGQLVKYAPARVSAQTAKRIMIEDQDERLQTIRLRAGNKAFEITSAVSCIGLIVYSSLNVQGESASLYDGMWYYLVFLFLLSVGVYGISLARYQNKY